MKYHVALLLLGLAEPVIASPDAVTPPEPAGNPGSWVTVQDYPVEALRRGHQGTSEFRLRVGPDGRVLECEITQSSGYTELDDQACISLQVRARFHPAHAADGTPVESEYSSSVRWEMPDGGRITYPTPEETSVEYVLTYNAGGRVTDCDIVETARGGEPMTTRERPNVCALRYYPNIRIRPFVDEGGNPVERKVRYVMRIIIED